MLSSAQPPDRHARALLFYERAVRAVGTALCLALPCSAPLAGEPGAADVAAHQAAGVRLNALIALASEKGERSGLETAEVKNLITTISDHEKVLRTGEYTSDELGSLLGICQVANRASVALTLFGATPDQMRQQAELIHVANRNVGAFQSQLAKIQPFLLRCLAKEVRPLERFVVSLPPEELTDVRKEGLMRARAGIYQVYVGALQVANDPRYREDYRIALLSTLAETSDRFTAVMKLPVRRELLGLVRNAASGASSPYALHLNEIAKQLADESCSRLCEL